MNYLPQSKAWHIIGAGAMGCLWAHHLLAAGRPVRLILHSAQRVSQLSAAGGVTCRRGDLVSSQPCSGLLADDVDYPLKRLLICCKAHQTKHAFATVVSHLAPHSAVLLLQNGMGIAEALTGERPDIQLFAGVTTDGAHLLNPFDVRQAGTGLTRIGRYPRDPNLQGSHQLIEQLDAPGLQLEACEDIYRAQWHKLVISCIINPLTALYDIRNGDLPGHPEGGPLMADLSREIVTVSGAMGIELNRGELLERAESVCRLTAANISSMRQDVRNRRETEIRYINGYLLSKAHELGLDCPRHRELVKKVSRLEKKYAGP